MSLTIAINGQVDRVEFVLDSVGSDSLRQCVVRVARGLRLRARPTPSSLRFPLVFAR